ncbi:hypothetical protein [Geothrix fuzhouensis]|uniref:hypothetical protein n=1 Tax=Geothrix fuzhouensis TaxID=2966451 RepID=UPI0021475E8D|nr:hypothetical protein [Geothrix fuzhouensis]
MLTRARRFLGFVLYSLAVAGGGTPAPIDQGLATAFFHEAKALSSRDRGRLWGSPLYGPMVFVDRVSRSVVANGPDAKGALQRSGDVWEGHLPEAVYIANTAIAWSGVHWTMVGWPLPENKHSREALMMHECFHRIQKSLGLEIQNRPCGHLDSTDGRVWLQLEWRALGEALLARGSARRRAIQDAFLFRAYRRSLFPGTAEAERAMELTEGLAEYTGIRLSARSEAQALTDALVDLNLGARKPTYVRSFAYASGPAYGLLLDSSAPGWRRHVKDLPDLGDLLQKALAIKLTPEWKGQALDRATAYGLRDLVQDETRREDGRKAVVAQFRSKLVEGPVLILPRTEALHYSFDPNHLLPLEGHGTVYPAIQASDAWGSLEASEGALMTTESLRIPAPEDPQSRPLKGAGWSLELTPGWNLVPDSRKGDYRLVQEPAKPALNGPVK